MSRVNRGFSAKELKEAAALVEESLLTGFVQEDLPKHTFSPGFELKMEPVLMLGRKQERNRRSVWTVAAAVALAMICAFSWLASNAQARDVIQRWIRETWQNNIVYRFWGKDTSQLPELRPTWLPAGYRETDVVNHESWFLVVYQNEYGDYIFFEAGTMQDGHAIDIVPDSKEYEQETVMVHGLFGELYIPVDEEEQSNLIWMDEESGMYYEISARLETSVIVHIAETVNLVIPLK